MDVRDRLRRKRAKGEELRLKHFSGFLYCTTVENRERRLKGGTVHQVSVENAATGIVEGILRESTAEEIVAYEQYCQQQREVLLRGERVRDPKGLMVTVRQQ